MVFPPNGFGSQQSEDSGQFMTRMTRGGGEGGRGGKTIIIIRGNTGGGEGLGRVG